MQSRINQVLAVGLRSKVASLLPDTPRTGTERFGEFLEPRRIGVGSDNVESIVYEAFGDGFPDPAGCPRNYRRPLLVCHRRSHHR